MKLFELTRRAVADLKSIALFTEKNWGRGKRNQYLQQMDDTFRLLGENSELGMACDFIAESYRKFPQGSHVIYYRSNESTSQIVIIRILHKRSDVNLQLGV